MQNYNIFNKLQKVSITNENFYSFGMETFVCNKKEKLYFAILFKYYIPTNPPNTYHNNINIYSYLVC